MPDPDKFAALRAAGVHVVPTCGSCVHFDGPTSPAGFPVAAGWGTCRRIAYQHGKHTDRREAGVPADALCPEHAWSPGAVARLGPYAALRGTNGPAVTRDPMCLDARGNRACTFLPFSTGTEMRWGACVECGAGHPQDGRA